jgi:hypothetical protein
MRGSLERQYAGWHHPAGMLLQISDADLRADLYAHFRRAGFAVEETKGTAIGVSEPDAPSPELEREEIELHLRAWQTSHPGVKAEVVG